MPDSQTERPWKTLAEIADAVRRCTRCPLSQTRTQGVPGEGPEHPEIMFVGEGPGFNEDKQGRPFVGAAGQFLNQLLGLANLKRQDVFITNVVKSRPPENRDPLPNELAACRPYLEAQIGLINPKIIVTLGRHSLGWFFPGESVTRARGRARMWKDIAVVPMLHPAAALHQSRYRELIENDFRNLPAILEQLRSKRKAPAAPPTPPRNEEPPPSKQLSMF